MTLQSWCKNMRLQQRRNVEKQCRDVAESAETEHPDIMMFLHDVATGLVFGQFLAHFESIIVGFKAQTLREREGGPF